MTTTTTALVTPIHADFTREQVELIKATICVGASDAELQLFVQTCQRMRLDPFARQIFAVQRYNSQVGRKVMTTQVSIDGFRLVAERTGQYAGQLGPFWTADGKEWFEVWLDKAPPRAAKVGILRHDFKEPIWAVATWHEYSQESSPMWKKMAALMLAKCAESLGLRRAFPNELSGIYSPEEMAQAQVAVADVVVDEMPAEVVAEIRAAVDQDPPRRPVAGGALPANQVPATAGEPMIVDGQLARIHQLRAELPGWDGDHSHPEHAYSRALRGYKKADGVAAASAKDLTFEQAKNLIMRMQGLSERKILRHARMEESIGTTSIGIDP